MKSLVAPIIGRKNRFLFGQLSFVTACCDSTLQLVTRGISFLPGYDTSPSKGHSQIFRVRHCENEMICPRTQFSRLDNNDSQR